MPIVYDVESWRLNEDGQIYRKGKLRYANGDAYDGEWVDGKREGHGIFTYRNGSRYTGAFQANLFHGFGILVEADTQHPFTSEWLPGSTYEGQFAHGKKHGKGRIVFGSGGSYDGLFAHDKFSGQGVRCYENGDRYEGEWKFGVWWGMGSLRCVDGATYIGECKNGEFHGHGSRTFPRGLGSYEGDFFNGEQHGSGARVFSDGSTYDGQWNKNAMHGSGVWTTASFTYVGDFLHGRPHGHGLWTFKNGDIYEGAVQQGCFHGRGKYTYKDGSWYDGEFIADEASKMAGRGRKHGQGTRQWANGNSYVGAWAHDRMHGHGTLKSKLSNGVYSLDMEYDGEFQDGFQTGTCTLRVWNPSGERIEFPHGSGNWYNSKGICIYTGTFLRGQFHGQGTLVACDGRRYEGEWSRGKRHGFGKARLIPLAEVGDETRMFIRGNNALYRLAMYEGMHVQDQRHGFGIGYYSNGDAIQGEYVNGQVDGVATYIFPHGKRRRGTWKLGQRISWLNEDDNATWATLEKVLHIAPNNQHGGLKHNV
ncbi:unnamed protein product [Aphanomyces euteiches]|nr:hypothetical protein AeRB84_011346 [Aphanomyces euteiches]